MLRAGGPAGGRVEFSALCPSKLRQRALRLPAVMPSVQQWTFNLAGADMGVMREETLALTVAEATMQDWLAALTQSKQAPLGFIEPLTQPASHPVLCRPVPVRRPVVCTRPRAASVSVAPEERASAVGGARSAYWVGLAAALTAMLVLYRAGKLTGVSPADGACVAAAGPQISTSNFARSCCAAVCRRRRNPAEP